MDARPRRRDDSHMPLLDLTDLELVTAARACRALAYQEERAAKRMENPMTRGPIEHTAKRAAALAEKFEAARKRSPTGQASGVLDYRITMLAPDRGSLQTRQRLQRPLVYLDHWAFRLFSDDTELREALASALAERRGSLCLGRLNVLEFATVTDEAQLKAAQDFVQALLPGLFFLDTAMMPVVERETAGEPSACADINLFADFGLSIFENNHWSARRILDRLAAGRVGYAQGFEIAKRILLDDMNSYANLDAKTIRESLVEARRRPRATLAIGRARMVEIHKDKTRPLDLNDASDLMHAIVPCAYCDFVLLDREWCDYVERARHRLQTIGEAKQPIAGVYSKSEVQRFLDDLRAHPGDPRPVPEWPPPS
jgi:hypothetical protein